MRFLVVITLLIVFWMGVGYSLVSKDEVVSERIPVPGQEQEVVVVSKYSSYVKDCVWEDPCKFVKADAYHQKVKWLMEHHRMQAGLLNMYREDCSC